MIEDAESLYLRMKLIRDFDTRAMQLYAGGEISGTVHPSVGQEAVAVGVCDGLHNTDYLTSNHRGHGHAIAKGAQIDRLMAELLGKVTGSCRGKGGSMHVADADVGLLGANGIVGAGLSIATGAALTAQIRDRRQVSVAMFGDGAVATGAFHESINLASLWRLPVIFVCENNGYAVSMSTNRTVAAQKVSDHAAAYRVPGETVDGMDLPAMRITMNCAIDRARNGDGPTLIEALTYRYLGHSRGDPNFGPYRSEEEVERWRERDPIPGFAAASGLDSEAVSRLDKESEGIIESALQYARESPFPDPAEALLHVT
jgi:TPP-dependent pyruvate/acetoin dehydrogenase alpha subunit